MCLKLQCLWGHRPGVLTALVLVIVVALVVLANLSFDLGERGPFPFLFWHRSYGWPFVWRRCIGMPNMTIGWYYSASRLAADLAIWLLILVGSGSGCEWLSRRYRPRLRWRLRTLLLAVAAVGLLCGWFIAARDRANEQDRIIAQIESLHGHVWVARRGPQWLNLLGVDRYRRHIIGADAGTLSVRDVDEKFLEQLAELPDLRHLFVEVRRITPRVVDALEKMRGLRTLSIEQSISSERDNGRMVEACAAAIGRMTHLERLRLSQVRMAGKDLNLLAGLSNLKLLGIGWMHEEEKSWLQHLPPLPELECIDLSVVSLAAGDLRYLTVLPRLRSLVLGIDAVEYTAAGWKQLASLESLEEVELDQKLVSAESLDSLLAVQRLRRVHLCGSRWGGDGFAMLALDDGDKVEILESELRGCRRALAALREAKPGIVVDSRYDRAGWPYMPSQLVPSGFDTWPHQDRDRMPDSAPAMTSAERARFDSSGTSVDFCGVAFSYGGRVIEIKF